MALTLYQTINYLLLMISTQPRTEIMIENNDFGLSDLVIGYFLRGVGKTTQRGNKPLPKKNLKEKNTNRSV